MTHTTVEAARIANLRGAAERKRRHAEARARDAIKTARKSGHPSTFRGIAEAAGVSPSFLYSHPEFRDQILRMRSANTPTRSRAPKTRNEATITALLESARREKKQLLELNEQLTRRLAAAHGELLELRRRVGTTAHPNSTSPSTVGEQRPCS